MAKKHPTTESNPGAARRTMGEGEEETPWFPTDKLVESLVSAQERGAIGPGAIEDHIAHALGFAEACPELGFAATVLDLGTGGGLPGLVLAERFNRPRFLLLEGRTKRANRLRADVQALSLQERVHVVGERAEAAAHDKDLREQVDVVVTRSFARPGVTAECASPFLRPGGALVVSDPPEAITDRWPEDPLSELGLMVENRIVVPRAFTVLRRVGSCPERYPRRVGIPEKRPLF